MTRRNAIGEAAEWLDGYLDAHGGRVDAGVALAAGRAAGHAERTLQNACYKLGLETRKVRFGGAWEWHRPDQDDEENLSWHDHAACAGLDPDVFFPTSGRTDDARRAKAICAGCPVSEPCLDYANAHAINHGIWGGKSERERRFMRRQARTPDG